VTQFRSKLLPIVLAACLLAILGGCGQRGDLYLPDSPPPHSGS